MQQSWRRSWRVLGAAKITQGFSVLEENELIKKVVSFVFVGDPFRNGSPATRKLHDLVKGVPDTFGRNCKFGGWPHKLSMLPVRKTYRRQFARVHLEFNKLGISAPPRVARDRLTSNVEMLLYLSITKTIEDEVRLMTFQYWIYKRVSRGSSEKKCLINTLLWRHPIFFASLQSS